VVASTNAKKKPPEGAASFDHPTEAAMAMRAGRSPEVKGVCAYAAKQQLGSFCKIRWSNWRRGLTHETTAKSGPHRAAILDSN
jgi:hypothetical protein